MMSSTLCFWTAQFLILDCTKCILNCTNWLDCRLRISPGMTLSDLASYLFLSCQCEKNSFYLLAAQPLLLLLPAADCVVCMLLVCQTLSIFCGLGMHNCQLHKNRERLLIQYDVTMDALLFNLAPDPAEVESLFVRIHCLNHIILFIFSHRKTVEVIQL